MTRDASDAGDVDGIACFFLDTTREPEASQVHVACLRGREREAGTCVTRLDSFTRVSR